MNSKLLYKKFFEQTYYYYVYKSTNIITFSKEQAELAWNIKIYNLHQLFSIEYYENKL